MDFHEYQRLALRTKPAVSDNLGKLNNAALGLSGESGEFTDLVKKIIFHKKPLDTETIIKLKKELGDILWYIVLACDSLEFSFEDVAVENINKLKKRYPTEFNYFDANKPRLE